MMNVLLLSNYEILMEKNERKPIQVTAILCSSEFITLESCNDSVLYHLIAPGEKLKRLA